MRTLLLFFTLLSLPLFSLDISKEDRPVTVRVLLTTLANDALIEVKGRHLLFNPKTDEQIANCNKSKRAKITTKENGLYWGENLDGIYELRIVPNEKEGRILVGGIQYRGVIEIYSIGGTINIVNEVDSENYLKSILGPKLTEKLPNNALDALVITERTHLYYQVQKDAFASWQVEANQVGYTGEVAAKKSKAVEEAVERTRDMILLYKNLPFPTSWGLDNAGTSVSYTSVYRRSGRVPPAVTHLPSIHNREKSKWKAVVPLKVLTNLSKLSNVTHIDLFHAEKSPKVYAVRLFGPEGHQDIDFFTFQKVLGEKMIQSNDFTFQLKGKKVHFRGYGKGPGVGLCLFSASILAKRTDPVEKILQAHFPKTSLINFREEKGLPITSNPLWH